MSVCLFVCLSVRPSVQPPIFLRHVCLAICLSVCPSKHPYFFGSHWTHFYISDTLVFFKIFSENSSFIKIYKITGTLHEDLHMFIIICRWIIHRMRNVADKTRNRNTHFAFRNFLRKSCRLWENVEKYCRAWQATGDNTYYTVKLHCALDN
jgi:hypothetical protein